MADKWGPIQIPLAAGSPEDAVGDPALTTLLGFLLAFLNANAVKVWNAIGVAPGLPCVKNVRPWNPSDAHGDHRGLSFNTSDLPALYAWRDEAKQEWLAEDYLRDITTLKVLWVFPMALQAGQRVRQPFTNAITKLVAVAIERGRTPGWIVDGDPDPRAADEGSSLYTYLNDVAINLLKCRPARVTVEGDAKPLSYAAAELTFELLEDLEIGLDAYAETKSLRVQQSNAGGDVVDDALFEDPDPAAP